MFLLHRLFWQSNITDIFQENASINVKKYKDINCGSAKSCGYFNLADGMVRYTSTDGCGCDFPVV